MTRQARAPDRGGSALAAAASARRRPRSELGELGLPTRRPSRLTLAQMQAAPGRLAAAAGRAARPGQTSCSAAACRAPARAAGGAARPAGRDQQVGLLVRALPGRVRRLPARLRRARARRSPSSASTPSDTSRGDARRASCARSRSATPATTTRAARPGKRSDRLDVHAGDRLLQPRGGEFIHQGPYPERGQARTRTSSATRWTR